MPTIPTQIRLTAADRAKVEAIRVRFGLPSGAAAIRYSVETLHREIEREEIPKLVAPSPGGDVRGGCVRR